jgi:phage shock protein A
MGLFARLALLIKSNINALISSSEDPEKMLNQLIDEMGEQLNIAKKQVAGAIGDEKRLARQVEIEAQQASEWEKKAMLAVRAGDDALAKAALSRKKEHDSTAAQYREQWQKQKTGVDQLKLALRALNGKIEEAKRKKGILIARKKRAEAQKAIHETMSGLKSSSAFEAFDQMASKIEQLEAEADASAQIAEEYTGDVLAHKFRELETTKGADEDLVELKRKMGLAPPAKAEPLATAARVRLEAEPGRATRIAEGQGLAEEEFAALDAAEQEELAKALAELDAREQALQVKK